MSAQTCRRHTHHQLILRRQNRQLEVMLRSTQSNASTTSMLVMVRFWASVRELLQEALKGR